MNGLRAVRGPHPFAGLFLSSCCEEPGSTGGWACADAKSHACLREAQRWADSAMKKVCSAVGVGLRSCFLSLLALHAAVPVTVPGRAIPRMLALPGVPFAPAADTGPWITQQEGMNRTSKPRDNEGGVPMPRLSPCVRIETPLKSIWLAPQGHRVTHLGSFL